MRFVLASDVHGHHGDASALAVLSLFIDSYKPEIRVAMGDIFDFAGLRAGATEGDALDDIAADFEAGCEFLAWFKPTHFMWGNHDHRLVKVDRDKAKHAALRHLAGQWIDRISVVTEGAMHVPYCKRRGLLPLGNITLTHGYAHGVNAVRQQTLVYGSMAMGHIHTVSRVPVEGHPSKVGYSIGCLCDLNPPYAETAIRTLAWQHGFAFGVVRNGVTTLMQASRETGGWVIPTLQTNSGNSSKTTSPPARPQSRAGSRPPKSSKKRAATT